MDYFRETFEGLKQTADGLTQANLGITRAVEAALTPKNGHEGLRETVQWLEGLVLELTKQLPELRRQQS